MCEGRVERHGEHVVSYHLQAPQALRVSLLDHDLEERGIFLRPFPVEVARRDRRDCGGFFALRGVVRVGDGDGEDHGRGLARRLEPDRRDGFVGMRVLPAGGPDADAAAPFLRVQVYAVVHGPAQRAPAARLTPAEPPVPDFHIVPDGNRFLRAVLVSYGVGCHADVGRLALDAAGGALQEENVFPPDGGDLRGGLDRFGLAAAASLEDEDGLAVILLGINHPEGISVVHVLPHGERRPEVHVIDALVSPPALAIARQAVVLECCVRDGAKVHEKGPLGGACGGGRRQVEPEDATDCKRSNKTHGFQLRSNHLPFSISEEAFCIVVRQGRHVKQALDSFDESAKR